MAEPHQLFSEPFVEEFAIEPAESKDGPRSRISERSIARSSSAGRNPLPTGPASSRSTRCSIRYRVADEPAGTAAQRFRDAFAGIGWSRDAERIWRGCAEWRGAEIGLHVRAGDTVTGAWSACLVHEKHMPVPYIREAVRRLRSQRVLAVSDRPELLEALHADVRASPPLRPAEVIDEGYPALPGGLRALADLAALSRCRRLLGPPRSAFTRLAAHMGCPAAAAGRRVARARYRARPAASRVPDPLPPVRDGGALRARDICWALDVFGEALDPLEALSLAIHASELDPEFAGVQSRVARCAATAGHFGLAGSAAASAIRLAEPVDAYDDPLFEALASEAVVRCLGWAAGGDAAPLPAGRLHDLTELCGTLRPYYTSVSRALSVIEVLRGLREQLSRAPATARSEAAEHLRRPPVVDPREARDASAAALVRHRSPSGYDALSTDLERILAAVRLAVGS